MSVPLNAISPLGGAIVGAVTGAAKSAAGDALRAIAQAFLGATQTVLTWLWQAISASTAVHLGGSAFNHLFFLLSSLAAVVILGLFVVEIALSAVRHSPGGMVKALRGVFIAVLATGMVIFLINELLAATDAISTGIITATTGKSLGTLGTAIMSYGALSSLANPAIVLLMSLVVLVASFAIWFALILRKLLVVLAAVFAPLAFSGAVASFSTGWAKKWIEGTVAMIVSKLFLVIILVTGYYTLLYGVGDTAKGGVTSVTQALGSVSAGSLLLALAAFAPWMAVRAVHFAGDHMAVVSGHASTATAGAQRVKQHAQTAASLASRIGSAGAGAAAGAGIADAAGGGGTPGPTPPPSFPTKSLKGEWEPKVLPSGGQWPGQDPPPQSGQPEPAPQPSGGPWPTGGPVGDWGSKEPPGGAWKPQAAADGASWPEPPASNGEGPPDWPTPGHPPNPQSRRKPPVGKWKPQAAAPGASWPEAPAGDDEVPSDWPVSSTKEKK